MFIREIAAFLQLTLMPGLLLIFFLRPQLGKIRSLLLVPALSLPVNYIFVSLAWALDIFNGTACWIYTGLTWAAVIYFLRRKLAGFFQSRLSDGIGHISQNIVESYREMSCGGTVRKTLAVTAWAVAVAGVLYCGCFFWMSVNEVFAYWDSALSWNFWAECWSMNEYPRDISYYPQLMPKNWALVYKLIGGPICFVPKAAISIFPLLTALMFLDYGIARRRMDMLLAIGIFSFYFHNVDYISHGGELDLAVAYCGAALFFLVNYAGEAEKSGIFFRRLWLGVLLVALAGSIKQAGLYLIPVFALLTGAVLYRDSGRLSISWRQTVLHFTAMLLLLLLIVAPGYISAEKRIAAGLDYSNTQLVTETIYGGKNYFERFVCSVRLFTLKMQCGLPDMRSARYAPFDLDDGFIMPLIRLYSWHFPAGIVMILLNIALLYGAAKERYMRLPGAAALLFFVIWSIFFCYDLRNLSLMVPLLALLAASGMVYFSRDERVKKLGQIKVWQVLLAGCLLFVFCYPGEFYSRRRISRYVTKIRNAGEAEVNRSMLEYHRRYTLRRKENGLPEKSPVVLTDYAYIKLLEPFRNRWLSCNFSIHSEDVLQNFLSRIDDPEITAVLLPEYASESVKSNIAAMVEAGKLIKEFDTGSYSLYVKPY